MKLKILKSITSYKQVLPAFMTIVTGKSRYLPDIEWSSESWTHNIFRVYEMLFWRKLGVRCESSVTAFTDSNGHNHVEYRFYTIESMVAQTESIIRKKLVTFVTKIKSIRFPDIRIPEMLSPKLAFEGMWTEAPTDSLPQGYVFTVGYDNVVTQETGGTPTQSVSFTVTGSNRFMVINASCRNDIVINTASYNSVGGTFAVKTVASGTSIEQANLYGLIASATGSNTMTTTSASSDCRLYGASYTGAHQTTNPTNTTTSTGDATSTSTITLTPTHANSWVFGTFNNNNGNDSTAGSGTTIRSSSGNGVAQADTNAAVSGSTTISVSGAGTASLRRNAAFAIRPIASAVLNIPDARVFFM